PADGPLVRSSVLELVPDPGQAEPPLLAHFVKLDDQVVRLLLGQEGLARRLAPWCSVVPPAERPLAPELERTLGPLVAHARDARERLCLYFHGRPGAGK